MATPSPYNYSKNTNSASDLDPTKKKPAGADASTTTPASPAGTASGQTGQPLGGMMRTPNGSTIGQSPMNPSMNLSAGQSNTPSQTLNYATRPGIGKTNFDTVNKPTPETFGQNNLANRAARPVGRPMSDPQRQAEMARRNAVANGDVSGAAKMPMGQQPRQVAGGGGQTPNGSTIRQSPMNPSAMFENDANHTYNYAERPGQGARAYTDDWDAAVDPSRVPFGQNNLANRAARPVGRSMSDPQRQAEMARRNAVANGGMSGAGEDEEMPPGRANGGPVKAGKAYLVGEEGPEIMVPKQSGTVVPNHAIQFSPMDERAGKSFSPAMRSDEQPGGDEAGAAEGARVSNALQTSEAKDASAPRPRRQISGLFLRPRAMPPEFAQQQQSGSRGNASSDTPGNSYADTPTETSARDEADDRRGDSWGNRPPQTQPAPPTATAGRLFEKRDAPEAFFMQQQMRGTPPAAQGGRLAAQPPGPAQRSGGGPSQSRSLSERLQQVAARMRSKEQRHDDPAPPAQKGAWKQAPAQTARKAPQPLASDGAESAPDQFKIHEADESAEFVLTDKKTDQPIQKDRKFGEHARSIMNEELKNSPTARALLQKAYDLSGKHVIIKMKTEPGESQPHIGLDGTITVFINPNTLRTGTLSHEIAHVIEGWKLAQGQRNRTITSGEAIDAARMDGRRELDSIAPVIRDETNGALRLPKQGPRDWKENEAMRAGNIVNAEISAAKVKAQLDAIEKKDKDLYKHLMDNPEEIAHMFWEEQKGKEAGIHQDNEGRPIPQGTRYGRYNYDSVLKILGKGVTREHLTKMKPNNW